MDIKDVDLTKINLEPGETLVLQLRGEEFLNSPEHAMSLKQGFERLFPLSTIVVLTLPEHHSVEFTKISEQANKENSCNTGSFCADCNCGKKEDAQKLKPLPLEITEEMQKALDELEDEDAISE